MVGAAMAHIRRLDAAWPTPFTMTFLGHEVDVLNTPPKQVEAIVRRHARRQLDLGLLKGLAKDHGWDCSAIEARYKHGIDWGIVRRILEGRIGDLSGFERRAYEISLCRAFWPESRRWAAGYMECRNCAACGDVEGDLRHNIIDCDCTIYDRVKAMASRRIPTVKQVTVTCGMEPLTLVGLPPLEAQLSPVLDQQVEGHVDAGWTGATFGDGSGQHQDIVECCTASWAIVRVAEGADHPCQMMRGLVTGWLRTVPRAETTAYTRHLEHIGAEGHYVGDCAQVVLAANTGVSLRSCSSSNVNADLWRQARALQHDRGAHLSRAIKTKAHRSRAEAETSTDDPLSYWIGNQCADTYAKEVSSAAANYEAADALERVQRDALPQVVRVAIAVAWKLKRWPELGVVKTHAARRRRKLTDVDAGDHVIRAVGSEAWECTMCRRWAKGQRGLYLFRCNPCRGALQNQSHASHVLRSQGELLWCVRCGAFAARLPRRLAAPCTGRPQNHTQRTMLMRLREGRDPRRGYTTEVLSARGREALTARGARESGSKRCAGAGLNATWGRTPERLVGRYLRLPGGPLHRAGPGHIQQDVADGLVQHLATSPAQQPVQVRRRLRTKTHDATWLGPSTASGSATATTSRAAPQVSMAATAFGRPSLCTPTPTDSWTRRVTWAGSGGPSCTTPCHKCGRRCRTYCKGCGRSLCAGCARGRAACAPRAP